MADGDISTPGEAASLAGRDGDFRLVQNGNAVAWTDSMSEILHYAAVYGQDGPAQIECKVYGSWEKIADIGHWVNGDGVTISLYDQTTITLTEASEV